MFKFIVHGSPVPTPRMTRGGVHAKDHPKRKQIDAYLQYKDDIGWCAKAAGIECIPKPVPVEFNVNFYLPDARNRDTSNLLKAAEDSLNSIAYDDDSQIVKTTVCKYIDRKCPRTEITIIPREDWEIET